MRTTKIALNGVEYHMCLSAGAMMEIEDTTDKPMWEAFESMNTMTEQMKLLHILLKWGNTAEAMQGHDVPAPPDEEQLKKIISIDEYADVSKKIAETITVKPKVEVEPSKKADGATQAE